MLSRFKLSNFILKSLCFLVENMYSNVLIRSRTMMYTTNSDAIVKYVNAKTGHLKILPLHSCNLPGIIDATIMSINNPPQDLHSSVAKFQSISGQEVSLDINGPVYPEGT